MGPDIDLCPGEPAVLTAVEGQTEYLWNTGQTTSSITVNEAGTYWVDVTGPDGSASDTLEVNYYSLPGVGISGESSVCIDQETELSATGGLTDYLWNNGLATNTVLVGAGQWSVSAIDDNGCLNTAVFVVDEIDTPLVQISGPIESCEGDPVELSVDATTDQNLTWNTGETQSSILVEENGTYSVTATNSCGTSSDSLEVNFKICDCEIFIPNAFTPNDDAVNDVFSPMAACELTDFSLLVFNRWGEVLYQSENAGMHWDGTYKGEIVQNGLYYYLMSYRKKVLNSTAVEYQSGYIELIR